MAKNTQNSNGGKENTRTVSKYVHAGFTMAAVPINDDLAASNCEAFGCFERLREGTNQIGESLS